ncbi:MAG: PilT/PilU family type 4a pilus ATPase [Burkholderiaceae bacterium]|nr:PilT/PilU family type 4a pilus ATPase [Burkholderiaceae bacterium]
MQRLLRLMAEQQASDVYLSAHAPATIKINGVCRPINDQPLPPEVPLNLLAEVASPHRVEELKKTGELNLSVPIRGVGNFRISAMRQRGTCALVIRFISPEVPPLETLGLPAVLPRLIMEKRGLILIVGATGVGKSTTLAALLDYRNRNAPGHILTIEDPIEFVFTHRRSVINQREVGTDTATLQIALKNAMRQAPDVIMIGEIRDRETMSAALAYAQAGQLCLSTLHANNSYQALHRILSFYPVQARSTLLGDLASSLRGIVSQRLVRTVDGQRTPAAEVLLNTSLISELIGKGDFSGIKEAIENALTEGSQTFEQDLARLIRAGRVQQREGLSHADSATNLLWRLNNDGSRRAAPPAHEQHLPGHDAPAFTDITLDVPATGFDQNLETPSPTGTAFDTRL